jgi:hypothetical protein
VKRVADFLNAGGCRVLTTARELECCPAAWQAPVSLKKARVEIPCFLGLMALER